MPRMIDGTCDWYWPYAEELGLDSVWSTDHLIASGPMLDSSVVLATAAAVTLTPAAGAQVVDPGAPCVRHDGDVARPAARTLVRDTVEESATRVEALSLYVPAWLRWFGWFGGVLTCVVPFAGCDLGQNLSYVDVTTILPTAMVSTVQLVTASTILAIILGVTIGIVTALRQYSGFDVSITFLSFFLYSLPSFLVAVLLKEFIAIGFNDFLADPAIPPLSVVGIAVVAGLIWQVLIGGDLKRRLIVFAVSGAATAVVLIVMEATSFFTQPALGPVGLPLIIAGVVVVVTLLVAGFENKRALLAAGITGALAYAAYFSLQWLFDISTPATIAILAVEIGAILRTARGHVLVAEVLQ